MKCRLSHINIYTKCKHIFKTKRSDSEYVMNVISLGYIQRCYAHFLSNMRV